MKNIKTHIISSDIRRALTGKGFKIGVVGMMLIIAVSSVESIFEVTRAANSALAKRISCTVGHSGTAIELGDAGNSHTLCAPFTSAFVDDINSGFIKLYQPRSGVNQYIKAKLIACGLSGGTVLFLGSILAYALSALVFMPMELAVDEGVIAPTYFAELLTTLATLFLSGAFWSLVGFVFASLTMSKYMAYASPFIIYYVLIILHERYFENLYILYPKEWLFPSDAWVLGRLGVLVLLAELTAIMSISFAVIAKRRLGHV